MSCTLWLAHVGPQSYLEHRQKPKILSAAPWPHLFLVELQQPPGWSPESLGPGGFAGVGHCSQEDMPRNLRPEFVGTKLTKPTVSGFWWGFRIHICGWVFHGDVLMLVLDVLLMEFRTLFAVDCYIPHFQNETPQSQNQRCECCPRPPRITAVTYHRFKGWAKVPYNKVNFVSWGIAIF